MATRVFYLLFLQILPFLRKIASATKKESIWIFLLLLKQIFWEKNVAQQKKNTRGHSKFFHEIAAIWKICCNFMKKLLVSPKVKSFSIQAYKITMVIFSYWFVNFKFFFHKNKRIIIQRSHKDQTLCVILRYYDILTALNLPLGAWIGHLQVHRGFWKHFGKILIISIIMVCTKQFLSMGFLFGPLLSKVDINRKSFCLVYSQYFISQDSIFSSCWCIYD